jgi:hypothetical protein
VRPGTSFDAQNVLAGFEGQRKAVDNPPGGSVRQGHRQCTAVPPRLVRSTGGDKQDAVLGLANEYLPLKTDHVDRLIP